MCIGKATRLARFLSGTDKTYRATVRLGFATTTDDLTGDPIGPPRPADVPEAALAEACRALSGPQMQKAPAFSAKWVQGRRAYDLARVGIEAPPTVSPVVVHGIEVLGHAGEMVELEVRCSAGTYVRALARDLGETLGVGAHLVALRRTASGGFTMADAVAWDEIGPGARLVALDALLPEMPAATVTAGRAGRGAPRPAARCDAVRGRVSRLRLRRRGCASSTRAATWSRWPSRAGFETARAGPDLRADAAPRRGPGGLGAGPPRRSGTAGSNPRRRRRTLRAMLGLPWWAWVVLAVVGIILFARRAARHDTSRGRRLVGAAQALAGTGRRGPLEGAVSRHIRRNFRRRAATASAGITGSTPAIRSPPFRNGEALSAAWASHGRRTCDARISVTRRGPRLLPARRLAGMGGAMHYRGAHRPPRSAAMMLAVAVAGCEPAVTEPSADLSGTWDIGYSTRARRACSAAAPDGLRPSCAASGRLTLTQTRTSVSGGAPMSGGCSSCGSVADFFGAHHQATGQLDGTELQLTMGRCTLSATVRNADVREVTGEARCVSGGAQTEGTWRMTRTD